MLRAASGQARNGRHIGRLQTAGGLGRHAVAIDRRNVDGRVDIRGRFVRPDAVADGVVVAVRDEGHRVVLLVSAALVPAADRWPGTAAAAQALGVRSLVMRFETDLPRTRVRLGGAQVEIVGSGTLVGRRLVRVDLQRGFHTCSLCC